MGIKEADFCITHNTVAWTIISGFLIFFFFFALDNSQLQLGQARLWSVPSLGFCALDCPLQNMVPGNMVFSQTTQRS